MKVLFLTLAAALFANFQIEKSAPDSTISTSFTNSTTEAEWVNLTFKHLTDDQKIGQLIMLRAHSDKDEAYWTMVENQIRQFQPGGICFFQGTPEKQAELTNRYQLAANLPLLVAMDAEWGLGMRLKESTISFPKQLMLGAIQDNQLIYEMGREIARECRRLGVNVNFAPDADINNNPANPVINDRSFGEDRLNVAAKSFQFMAGLQDGGVLACAKHFPGHGDTDVDSHFDLPVISHDGRRLDSLELMPFRVLVQHGIGSVMVAHLSVPAIDTTRNLPTTLSERAVYRLLRKSMGFDGLIFTDGMEMKGVTKFYGPGEANVKALAAGNDMVLLPENVEEAVAAIKKALETGALDWQKIDDSVKRILATKFRLGLQKGVEMVNSDGIRRDLNSPEAVLLKRKLMANSLTLVRDLAAQIPIQSIENQRFASISLGADEPTVFQNQLGFYAPIDQFFSSKEISPEAEKMLLDTLKNYSKVFVSLHQTRTKAVDNYGLTESMKTFISKLNAQNRVVLTVFGSPYSLKFFDEIPTVLLGFTEEENAQSLSAQAIFGAIPLKGRLPVTASAAAKFAQGIDRQPVARLKYDLPEAVGMSSDSLKQLDLLADEMFKTGAAPGGQMLVVKDGSVVWQKAWGFQTYEQMRPVRLTDLYDLASVTKISAATISLMKLVDERRLDIAAPMSRYIPELKKARGKEALTVGEILAHQAGLVAWIPFYKNTLDAAGMPDSKWYRSQKEGDFSIEVAQNLWLKKEYVDSIWLQIFQSKLRDDNKYVYSDLTMYLGARAIENITGKNVAEYATANFYQKLGLATMGFQPLRRFPIDRIAPTEEDNYFRHQRIQGHVHDMGAAQLGGISGHAGLFSNANDLAILLQMLLNGGNYAGQNFLKKETVAEFSCRFGGSTRRGLGFDLKECDPTKSKNMCDLAGMNTYGHMGFTGNSVWVDPDERLIFIFLSNRTYPSMDNNRLMNGDFRPRAQAIVYRSIQKNR